MNDGQAAAPMPQYQSIKKVWALEIDRAEHVFSTDADDLRGRVRLTFTDRTFAPKLIDPAVVARYVPSKGDFFVVYEDGYQSISPGKAFREGYVPL